MYFSIIVPTYQDSVRLFLLLEVLGNQSLNVDLWEVIVVNNDPKHLIEFKQEYSFSITITTELKVGSYAARNKGISKAKGDIIVFTDSDCLPDRDWLKHAKEFFSQDFKKEIGILTGPVPLFFKNPEQLSNAEVYEKYTGFTTDSYAKEGHAITANWFSYKDVLQECGCFNSNLKSNGDSELSGKISTKYQIVYSDKLIVHHPARYLTSELVNKYKRVLGGTYERKYIGNALGFLLHIINFIFKRYRFFLKKFFTVSFKESRAIFKVCNAINGGAIMEYLNLLGGGDSKR